MQSKLKKCNIHYKNVTKFEYNRRDFTRLELNMKLLGTDLTQVRTRGVCITRAN